MYSKCIRNVLYLKCIRNVFEMYSKCIRNAFEMYSELIHNHSCQVRNSFCKKKCFLNMSFRSMSFWSFFNQKLSFWISWVCLNEVCLSWFFVFLEFLWDLSFYSLILQSLLLKVWFSRVCYLKFDSPEFVT